MSQNRLIWTDERNGNPDIYLYDLITGQERRITTNTAEQFGADIAGDRIVWVDDRNGNFDIYMYDLSTNVESPLITDISDQINLAVYDDRVVWTDYRNGNADIFMYDIAAGIETEVAPGPANQDLADVSDRYVVWQDNRNGNFDIYLFDMVTGTERQLTSNAADQISPAVDGDRVAWMDQRNGNWDIYVFDLSTNTETAMTSDAADQSSPMLDGDRLVWPDMRNGNYDIYMYDFSTGQETQVTKDGESQLGGRIFGDYIAWSDFRNGNWDIYAGRLGVGKAAPDVYANRIVWRDYRTGAWQIFLYDVATDVETQITTNRDAKFDPRIYGDRIVWTDLRNGSSDIYMFDVASGLERRVTTSGTAARPDIYGDYIVWLDYRDGLNNTDVFMYHIPTATETLVSSATDHAYETAIYGNRIVWTMRSVETSSDIDVFVLDIVTGSVRRLIFDDGFSQTSPTIYGNRVAWLTILGARPNIHAIDSIDLVSGGTPVRIPTDSSSTKAWPMLFGGLLVWTDLRNNNGDFNYDIFLFDFNTRIESQLTSNTSSQVARGFYGTRVVWQDSRNDGISEIYYGDLIVPLPPIERIGAISTSIQSIPLGDFAAPSSKQTASTFQTLTATSDKGDKVRENRKNSLLNRLQAVTMELQVAETTTDPATRNSAYQSAVDQLRSMLEKMDGFAERGAADVKGSGFTPDWIITASSQGLVDPLIRDLILSLEALIVPSH